MHADLKWLAENEPYWAMDDENYLITINKGSARYVHYFDFKTRGSHRAGDAFTRAQWQAARDELFTQRAAQRQRPKIKTQITAWHVAEDEILASEMSGAEPCPEDPFASPEEDEAWAEAEKRMDIIGHNGGTGEHYESPASKYHVQIKGQWVDVYDILTAYSVTNPADAHAIKKMLCPGQRGAKDGIQDRQEAIVSLQRAIELEQGR
jgi:hypothetical protein